MYKIRLVILFLFLIPCSGYSNDAITKVDYSSPQKTIKTYFENYNDKTMLENSFYPAVSYTGQLDKWWLEYVILQQKPSDKIGKKTYSGVFVSKDAVEIIVEVKMNHPVKNNPKTKFWFLLQEINKEWKIIEHSHISDKTYPAYDYRGKSKKHFLMEGR